MVAYDVMMKSKDFKVFLDFMDSKDATYHMNFDKYMSISVQCIANDGRYIGELIRSSVHKLKYTCIKPVRISFDSKMKDSLRKSSSRIDVVTITGPSVVFGEDQYTVESRYVNEPLPPIVDDSMERVQEMTLSRDEFERVVNILHREKIEAARLHFNTKSRMLEVSVYTKSLSPWSFGISASDVRLLGERLDVFLAQEEHPTPQVMNQIYDVEDLLSTIKAMKYHYGRHIMFSLSLLQDERLLFESGNEDGTLTQRCILRTSHLVGNVTGNATFSC